MSQLKEQKEMKALQRKITALEKLLEKREQRIIELKNLCAICNRRPDDEKGILNG